MKEEEKNSVFVAHVWLCKGGDKWLALYLSMNCYKFIFGYPEVWFSMVSLSPSPRLLSNLSLVDKKAKSPHIDRGEATLPFPSARAPQ